MVINPNHFLTDLQVFNDPRKSTSQKRKRSYDMDQDKPTSTSKKLRQSAEQTGDDISSNSDTTDSESEELQNARPGRKKNWVYFRPPVTKKKFRRAQYYFKKHGHCMGAIDVQLKTRKWSRKDLDLLFEFWTSKNFYSEVHNSKFLTNLNFPPNKKSLLFKKLWVI